MDESNIKYNEFLIDAYREKNGKIFHMEHGHVIGEYKFLLREMKSRARAGDVLTIYARHTENKFISAKEKRNYDEHYGTGEIRGDGKGNIFFLFIKQDAPKGYKPKVDYRKFEKYAEYTIAKKPQPRKRGSRPGKESKS